MVRDGPHGREAALRRRTPSGDHNVNAVLFVRSRNSPQPDGCLLKVEGGNCAGTGDTDDMSDEGTVNDWAEHQTSFDPDRPETFAAYVAVWERNADVRRAFGTWLVFAQCASADREARRDSAALIREAEAAMARNGYRIGPSTDLGARRWLRTDGKLHSTSIASTKTTAATARQRTSRATSNRAPAKKSAATVAAIMRPRHKECPNDPGMMVPLDGECMCGWSPAGES